MLKKAHAYFLARKSDFAIFVIVFLGSSFWSLTMVRSGLCFDKSCVSGIGFWGANGHDGIWHLALIRSLASGSLENPVFAGEMIKNYHLGYDFILSLFYRFFGIEPSLLYFQIFPPILAILIGFLTFKLVFLLTKSKSAVFWSLFFVYFGGGFGWMVNLIREGRLGGDSMFWAQSSVTTLVNPPFAMSLVFLLLGLLFFDKYLKKGDLRLAFLTILFWGFLSQVKVYASILIILSLFPFLLVRRIIRRVIFILVLIVFLNIFVLVPFNEVSSSIVEFKPFWFLETLMAFPDRLGWTKFYQAMTTYYLSGSYFKAFLFYFLAFLIFFFGNLGTRFLFLTRLIRRFNFLDLFLFLIAFWGLLLPMFFVQKGTPWNTIQFFYYSLFFFGVFAGIEFSLIFSRGKGFLKVIIVLFFTLPTTFTTMGHYLSHIPQSRIPQEELEALRFLSSLPSGRVLSLQIPGVAYDKYDFPIPLYDYDSTSYVSAFSGQKVYLEDLVNLGITGYHYQDRLERVKAFIKFPDSKDSREFLKIAGIDYVYIVRRQSFSEEKIKYLSKVFENERVLILKVNR